MSKKNNSYKIGGYLSKSESKLVTRALRVATEAHKKQKRLSGEPYIEHPLAVAQILSNMRQDGPTLAAALLHDVVEDTPVTLSEIGKDFGDEIATLVDGVTKVAFQDKANIIASTEEEVQLENLVKLFRAILRDSRVLFIRLADRLHNMRTLNALPKEKQKRTACETLRIHVRLATLFGLEDFRDELERLSLAYLGLS